ncbi:hypothetical protein N007_05375 [Alicyclobacillus acidoterrestris ATCC 49025]|nr:hypothetical protein N007_05375 [Alicyclobacillus acidoterrestris ATCC 49025]
MRKLYVIYREYGKVWFLTESESWHEELAYAKLYENITEALQDSGEIEDSRVGEVTMTFHLTPSPMHIHV